MKGVIERKSAKHPVQDAEKGFFKNTAFTVNGHTFSLDDIKHVG
jgi:hypothetical protein